MCNPQMRSFCFLSLTVLENLFSLVQATDFEIVSVVNILLTYDLWNCSKVIPLIRILNNEVKLLLLSLFLTIVFTKLVLLNSLSNIALGYSTQKNLVYQKERFH